MTADRIAHYQQVSGGGEELRRMFQDIEPAHPFALSLQGLLPHLAAALPQQASLSALSESVGFSHQQVRHSELLFKLFQHDIHYTCKHTVIY